MSKFTVILISIVFLIGVGALVCWKTIGSEESDPDGESVAADDHNKKRSRRVRGATGRIDGDTTDTSDRSNLIVSLEQLRSLTDYSESIDTRLNIASRIDSDISVAAVNYLLELLNHTPPQQFREQWWLVLNEIMGQMRKKGVALDRLGLAFVSLVEDSDQAEVVRDYAVQHLSLWIAPPTANTPGEPSKEVIARAIDAIVATVTDLNITETSIPGTSLMALTVTSEYLPEDIVTLMWEKLDPVMTSMLKSETHGSLATRTTIIQSLAMRSSQLHLPLIQAMARDTGADPSMRISSIAALGIYRSQGDVAYLNAVAQGNTRFRYAAQSALKKINQ